MATIKVQEAPPPPPPPTPPPEYVLTLTEAEAMALRTLLGYGVSSLALDDAKLRGIYDALNKADVKACYPPIWSRTALTRNTD